MQNIAVHGDGVLPQLFQIHRRPKGAAHQTLDLGAAGRQLQLGNIPLAAIPIGPGKHRVLGGHPARPLWNVGRDAILHAGSAQHMGVPASDQAGTLGKFVDVRNDFNGPQFVCRPAVDTGHGKTSSLF
ncbi:hypothetical protein SDC9_186332 [bioreactor metagenome]|uniref:Uncharacterized protein n=1 Tax=bioreactor metagenome TaxID=1076179 RepID=A0A645HIM3_9ZZZZ